MPAASTIVIAGDQSTNKAMLMVDTLYSQQPMVHMGQLGIGIVGSIESRAALRNVLPDLFIHDELEESVLLRFWSRVKAINGNGKLGAFIVLDDTGYGDRLWGNEVMKDMMQNGHKYNLTMIICTQYAKGLSTCVPSQIDYVYVLKEKSHEMQEKIWNMYGSRIFPCKAVWEEALDECRKNSRTLVLRNSDVSKDKGDGNVFFYG